MNTEPTLTMLQQMHSYAKWAEESGSYYGHRETFWTRHESIKSWLEQQIARHQKRESRPSRKQQVIPKGSRRG